MFVKIIICFGVFFLCGVNCCVRSSFNNTEVTLVGVRGVKKFSGCFEATEALEKVSLIQVINENVRVLYEGAFSDLQYLVDIILDSDKLNDIYPGAFQNLPKLYCIRIRNNDIYEIRDGVFNNLPISELNLANNSINSINQNAFDYMPNLNIILLNNNKITRINPDWFSNSPKLSVLNFENNLIAFVPEKAFKNIYGVHIVNHSNVTTNIILSSNKIVHVYPKAFENFETLGWLFLDNNKIEFLDESVFDSFKQIDWVKLENNNLNCVPDNVFRVVSSVMYYLEGNPLSEDCKTRHNISSKNGNNSF